MSVRLQLALCYSRRCVTQNEIVFFVTIWLGVGKHVLFRSIRLGVGKHVFFLNHLTWRKKELWFVRKVRTISTLQTAPHTKLPICVKKAVLLFFLGGTIWVACLCSSSRHEIATNTLHTNESKLEYATHERIQIRTRYTRTNPNSNTLHTNESKPEHATHERIPTRTRYTRANSNPNTLHTNEFQLEHTTDDVSERIL